MKTETKINDYDWQQIGHAGLHAGHHLSVDGMGDVNCIECGRCLTDAEADEAWPHAEMKNKPTTEVPGYSYPAIVVERPHQRSGTAWLAETAEDIIAVLADNKYGDNWGWEKMSHPAAREFIAEFLDDDPDLLEALGGISQDEEVVILHTDHGGYEVHAASETESELDFAIEYIGHDLRGLDILDEQAARVMWTNPTGHNFPYADFRDAMIYAGWLEDEDED